MKQIKILKLGGSLFTDKNASSGVFKKQVLHELCWQIGEYLNTKDAKKSSLILSFGTGSFGHQPAKKYNVLQEFNPMGTIETYKSVARLSTVILDILNKYYIKAVPVDIMSCVVAQNGRIKSMCTCAIQVLITNGFVPILFGNVVMDFVTQVTIISSDQIATYLAKELGACALGFGSQEDGVYGKDKIIIPEINSENFQEFKKYIGCSKYPDVTQGMFGKVHEILQESPVSACIFNAKKNGNIFRFLKGEALGTKVFSKDNKEVNT